MPKEPPGADERAKLFSGFVHRQAELESERVRLVSSGLLVVSVIVFFSLASWLR